MGLLNWLKKESKNKRRLSAPPEEFRSNIRNQEYLEALEKFNEWRRTQSLENSNGNQTSTATNTSVSLLPATIPEEDTTGSSADPSTVQLRESLSKAKRNNRLSLPATSAGMETPQQKKQSKSRTKRQAPKKPRDSLIQEEHPPNYAKDDDVREFEQIHCQNNSGIAAEVAFGLNEEDIMSPPRRFYKKNAKPYHEKLFSKTPTSDAANPTIDHRQQQSHTTPQPPNNAPSKPVRRKKSNKNGVAGPIPKIRNSLNCSKGMATETDSMSEPSHFNGSYKNYDINSSSMYDELVISSRGYKGKLNVSLADNQPSPPQPPRISLTYQQVVNKHGDLVEYALPLVEDGKVGLASDTDTLVTVRNRMSGAAMDPIINDDLQSSHDQLIDENFRFLSDKFNFSDSIRKFLTDPLAKSSAQKKLQITDLDKSELERSLLKDDYTNRKEIFQELDTLGRWVDTIDNSKEKEAKNNEAFNLNDFLFRNETIIVSYPKEVLYRTSVLRSAIPMPIDLAGGIFRNTNVTVRKHHSESTNKMKYSQEALRRDFTVLKQVRHADIMTLMAVVADRSLNQMQIILEPFEFSLNYYIHAQNNELSVSNVLIVMQQIAQAVNYLQECGFIHSNISSHSILMRQDPMCVKLGFFELATDINTKVRREIISKYGNMIVDPFGRDKPVFNSIPDYSLLLRGSEKYAKEKYMKLSKNINLSKVNQSGLRKQHQPPLDVPFKYLPYLLEYRQQFSLYFYQAPELISTQSRFVLPNTLSDVYALTLLLWELLNNCVPYVIYSYTELEKLYKSKQTILPPIRPERCDGFEMILKMGLEEEPVHRVMSIQDFIALLDDAKARTHTLGHPMYDVVKKAEPVVEMDLIKEGHDEQKSIGKENVKLNVNENIQPKLATKTPFAFKAEAPPKNNHFYENLLPDPQKRMENAILSNISMETFETKSTTTCGEFSIGFSDNTTMKDDKAAEDRRTAQRTNGELSGGLGKGYTPKATKRFSFKDRKTIAKKPSPTKTAAKRSVENLFNLSQSTIFNSVSDVGKEMAMSIVSPTKPEFVTMERTSTLKRKKPVSKIHPHVVKVFPSTEQTPSPKVRLCLEDQLNEMDKGLKMSKEDLLEEFKNSPQMKIDTDEFIRVQSAGPKVNPHKGMVARARAQYMKRLLAGGDQNGSGDQFSKTATQLNQNTPNNRIIPCKISGVPKSVPASYKFSLAKNELTVPQTPIARTNKLLKHAWLSDQKLEESVAPKMLDFEMCKSSDDILNRSFVVETEVADELRNRNIFSIEKLYKNPNESSCSIALDDSFAEKKINVSLKIIHNNLEIYNNSLTNASDIGQKIQQIQLDMFDKEGGQHPSLSGNQSIKKPEIKIKMTPSKNGIALNDLSDDDRPIGKRITDLTSEIRQCFENYECDYLATGLADKLVQRPAENKITRHVVIEKELESPKLIKEQIQGKGLSPRNGDDKFRFEKELWHKEKSICEKSAGSAEDLNNTEWISVQEVIKRIEGMTTMESPRLNKSSNPGELSIVHQSRLPNGGAAGSPQQVKEMAVVPVATSSPLVEDNIRRFNSILKPIRLATSSNQSRSSMGGGLCCPGRNIVRRATTFNDAASGKANRSDRQNKRITTKVTLNLKKVQVASSANSSRAFEGESQYFCRNCGTDAPSEGIGNGASNGNLSTSMISYSTTYKPFEKQQETISRRSSSCSTLLKLNPMDDLYIDDDFEDSFLTPNIELVKNDDYVIQFND